ncbi:hypothetical protein Vau01_036020 [Virgisporangium aurantiacum]|uniref:Lanthionine synthetase n=2 Tax=Virgisporangium aurantiacum TaxID=175570 RepID=A0A8J3Z286_9ACTN|nr:hypothetical protein Vau01_036020 [Virgisporangium aurantiacum]
MTRDAVNANANASLYAGAPAIAFALRTADHPAYADAIDALDAHIDVLTRRRLDRAHDRITSGQLPALREFDLISGLTGIGTYLLHRPDDGLLREVLSYLVRLTESLDHEGETLPGWWTSNGPDDRPSPDWPGGHANLGMAHGIAGPLALLSTAMNRRITVLGHRDAIIRICTWLDRWRLTDPHPRWPGIVRRTGQITDHLPQRPSWCYGTPGLARAQQLAGIALGDTDRQKEAEGALAGCLTNELDLLNDASLCHGWAGLLHATRRVAAEAMTGQLYDLLPSLERRTRKVLLQRGLPDHDGLLEGTAGVHLVKESVEFRSVAPRWEACLLLA